jgi:hypothetical protein
MRQRLELRANGQVIGLGNVDSDVELSPERISELTPQQYLAEILSQTIRDNATHLLISGIRSMVDPSYVLGGISYSIVPLNKDPNPLHKQLEPLFKQSSVVRARISLGGLEEMTRDAEMVRYQTGLGFSYVFSIDNK